MNVRLEEQEREQQRRVARAAFWQRLFIVVLGTLLIGSIAAITVLAGSIRNTQIEGTPLGKSIAQTNERILDCTDSGANGDPAGECYRQNQKRTAELLRQVLGDNIVVAVCATSVPAGLPLAQAIERVTACVLEQRQES